MEIHKFPWFWSISWDFGPAALASKKNSNSYAFSMVVVLIFLPEHGQIWFFMQILVPNQYWGIFMKFPEILMQNQILEVLRGPWPARAGNVNIPCGILRFLSLPGPLRSLQKGENHKFPIEITFFHSRTVLSAPGPQKMVPERYVYVGFLAGAANVGFGCPKCILSAQNHKSIDFPRFQRILKEYR